MTMTDATTVGAELVFARWLACFEAAVQRGDGRTVAATFAPDAAWKDILAFTWTYRTFIGAEAIAASFDRTLGDVGPQALRPATDRTPPRFARRSARQVVEAYFDFDNAVGRCTAFVRIGADEHEPEPKALLLLTTLHELRGAEERVGLRRPTGLEYSTQFAGENWLDQRRNELRYEGRDPDVLIVGGGQAGLALAARLRHTGTDALVVEQLPRIGDNWRNRYHSLTLHNEVWANHLPYLRFPDTWPTFVPKDMLAGWLEYYAEALELNVWTNTTFSEATFDGRCWTAKLTRSDGSERTVHPKHLVLATGGVSGVPNMPQLPGLADFAGEVIHSSQFRRGAEYAGRSAIVVGTGNSGHDVAQDLHENGATVTMVQRSPTCVVSLVPSGTLVYALYSEGPPVEDIDLITAAIPYPMLRESYQWLTKRTCELDRELIEGLARAGFETDFGEDGTGFHMMYLRRGGGYYINVGCSDLIAKGDIRLVQARDMDQFVPTGLRMQGGEVIQGDLVVMATGYENQMEGVRRLLGDEIANKIGPIWGFDEHYTMRNMYQRTAQPNFWLMGGSLMECRFHSRFLALQITADLHGIDTTPRV